MKKVLLGLFLAVSALSFSAERTLSYEETFLDKKTGIVYAIGEKIPYTGIVKNYKIPEGNNVFEGKISFKNGIIDGVVELYYPNGKLQIEASFKEDKLDGISKEYDETGKIIDQTTFKDNKQIN